MADVKISALPASTTPLAGTEVLPIVQSSTTKQVSVANLTAGRAVSASSLTLTTQLSVANGGTGLTSLTAGYIPYGNGTGAFGSGALIVNNSNLGLGVTPVAWVSGVIGAVGRTLQGDSWGVASYGGFDGTDFATNAYNSAYSGPYKYRGTAAAAMYSQRSGAHYWWIAPSGTAGSAISFTQAMTLDASGALSIPKNVNTQTTLLLGGSLGFGTGTAFVNNNTEMSVGNNLGIGTTGSQYLALYTNSAERARIDASGNVVVGTAALATSATDGFLYIPTCAGAPTGAATSYTGRSPLVVDSTNNRLYVRVGSTWKYATLN